MRGNQWCQIWSHQDYWWRVVNVFLLKGSRSEISLSLILAAIFWWSAGARKIASWCRAQLADARRKLFASYGGRWTWSGVALTAHRRLWRWDGNGRLHPSATSIVYCKGISNVRSASDAAPRAICRSPKSRPGWNQSEDFPRFFEFMVLEKMLRRLSPPTG